MLGGIFFVVLLCTGIVLAQSAPASPDHPWHTSAELKIQADARNVPDTRIAIDSAKMYSLPQLIDLAEAHNPATRVSWERARAQAAGLGVAQQRAISHAGSCRTFADQSLGDVLWEPLLRPGCPRTFRWSWISITPSLTSAPAPAELTRESTASGG